LAPHGHIGMSFDWAAVDEGLDLIAAVNFFDPVIIRFMVSLLFMMEGLCLGTRVRFNSSVGHFSWP